MAMVPLRYFVSGISHSIKDTADAFISRKILISEVKELQDELLSVRQQLQRANARAMNVERLQKLLNVLVGMENNNAQVAGLQGISYLPYRMTITLNKGTGDGISVGNFVLDGWGLVGMVVETTLFNSLVLRITDPSHSIMVENGRTGKRILLTGNGSPDRLNLRHLPIGENIEPGDPLYTSGLGRVYPAGHLVAIVDSVTMDKSAFRLRVDAIPQARVEQSRRYLIVGSK